MAEGILFPNLSLFPALDALSLHHLAVDVSVELFFLIIVELEGGVSVVLEQVIVSIVEQQVNLEFIGIVSLWPVLVVVLSHILLPRLVYVHVYRVQPCTHIQNHSLTLLPPRHDLVLLGALEEVLETLLLLAEGDQTQCPEVQDNEEVEVRVLGEHPGQGPLGILPGLVQKEVILVLPVVLEDVLQQSILVVGLELLRDRLLVTCLHGHLFQVRKH